LLGLLNQIASSEIAVALGVDPHPHYSAVEMSRTIDSSASERACVRAARALLRWEQRDLARASGIPANHKAPGRRSRRVGCAQFDGYCAQTRF